MKLNGSLVVVAAMMVGSLGAMGCKSNDKITDTGNAVAPDNGAVAPEETPETAPVATTTVAEASAASPGTEQDYFRGAHYWGPRPPAARFEDRGYARAGHFWSPGYYGWNGREHAWHGGGWYPERPGYAYVGPRWENRYGRYEYLPGRWHRR